MRYLSPRKVPAIVEHKGSGQDVVRFVEPRKGASRGPVEDHYLGVHGSAQVGERYRGVIQDWIERSLQVGWAPAGWDPGRTGHANVLTVGELVEGYRRYAGEVGGLARREERLDPEEVREYREMLDRGRELMRRGRPAGDWSGDRESFREGRSLVEQARRRYGGLDDALERLWNAQVLEDMVGDFGATAAAVMGDHELRMLRKKWTERGVPLSDRKGGLRFVRAVFSHVIGRGPRAEWNLERKHLQENAHEFGLDFGHVAADGRWVRTG